MLHHDVEHAPALVIVEPRDLARDAERRDAVDSCRYEKVDDLPEARLIEVAIGVERRRKNGIHTFELQESSSSLQYRDTLLIKLACEAG
jgi:hypothetical protein